MNASVRAALLTGLFSLVTLSVQAGSLSPDSREDLSEKDRKRVEKVIRPATAFDKPERFERMSAGATTSTKLINADAFSHSSANLEFAELERFLLGNGLFRKDWVSSPSSTQASDGLGPLEASTHRVRALRTYRYPGPDLKFPPLGLISIGSKVTVTGSATTRGLDYAVLSDGSAVVARHLAELDRIEKDWVAVAEEFLGTPYLWGGRTSLGLDCSALIQLAAQAGGYDVPRDSDMQQAHFSDAVVAQGCKPIGEPMKKSAGFINLKGNLFDSAIMKTSVISEEFRKRYLSNPDDPEAFEGVTAEDLVGLGFEDPVAQDISAKEAKGTSSPLAFGMRHSFKSSGELR